MRTDQQTTDFQRASFAGLGTVLQLARQHFLTLLVVAYVLSHFFPDLGLLIRKPFFHSSEISFVNVMLSSVLFTLGLSAPLIELKQVVRNAKVVGAFYAFRFVMAIGVGLLSDFALDTSAGIFLGVIAVCAAPTAASSASWSLQLGSCKSTTIALILGTTLLSVLLGPLLLTCAGMFASPTLSEDLASLREVYTASFVVPWVVLPVLAGMCWRSFAPSSAVACRAIGLKLNPILLLLLNYANAASSLPKINEAFAIGHLLAILVGTVALFSVLTLSSNFIGSRVTNSAKERLSQSIGTAMSNTGLMLVIATLAMPERLEVHLPIIVYTFVQHLGVARSSERRNAKQIGACS